MRQEFIFAVKESGVPFYCSEEFTNQYCRRVIGYSLNVGWLDGHKKLYDPKLTSGDKDYGFVAYVGRFELGKGLQDIDRVALTKEQAGSITAYKAMFAKDKDGKQKYNVGIVGHTGMRKFWQPITFFKGAAKYHDCFELMTSWI